MDLPPSNRDDASEAADLRAQLAAAQSALRQAQAEQARLTRTLHDTVAQSLTGAYLHALVVVRQLQQSGSDAADDLNKVADMIHRAVGEVQALLRSPPTDETDRE